MQLIEKIAAGGRYKGIRLIRRAAELATKGRTAEAKLLRTKGEEMVRRHTIKSIYGPRKRTYLHLEPKPKMAKGK